MQEFLFVLVGNGENLEKYKKIVKEKKLSNNILFFGTSNNIPEVMQIFDVFILPSLYEGLPVVEIEAQAAGVRSIVSNKVTKEIDLGIGLVDFAGIDDENINEWIELLGKPNEELDYEKINEALEKNGYNVQSTVKSFYELYSGE